MTEKRKLIEAELMHSDMLSGESGTKAVKMKVDDILVWGAAEKEKKMNTELEGSFGLARLYDEASSKEMKMDDVPSSTVVAKVKRKMNAELEESTGFHGDSKSKKVKMDNPVDNTLATNKKRKMKSELKESMGLDKLFGEAEPKTIKFSNTPGSTVALKHKRKLSGGSPDSNDFERAFGGAGSKKMKMEDTAFGAAVGSWLSGARRPSEPETMMAQSIKPKGAIKDMFGFGTVGGSMFPNPLPDSSCMLSMNHTPTAPAIPKRGTGNIKIETRGHGDRESREYDRGSGSSPLNVPSQQGKSRKEKRQMRTTARQLGGYPLPKNSSPKQPSLNQPPPKQPASEQPIPQQAPMTFWVTPEAYQAAIASAEAKKKKAGEHDQPQETRQAPPKRFVPGLSGYGSDSEDD